jgi:hypothetical protein
VAVDVMDVRISIDSVGGEVREIVGERKAGLVLQVEEGEGEGEGEGGRGKNSFVGFVPALRIEGILALPVASGDKCHSIVLGLGQLR